MMSTESFSLAGVIHLSSQLSISDTSYFYDSPVLVPLPSGIYEVLVWQDEDEGQPFVHALKVVPVGMDGDESDELGHLNVDFGQVGVCDRTAVERAFDHLGDEGMQRYYDQLEGEELVREIILPENAVMISVQSGFGDGRYGVKALRSKGGDIIGAVVYFALE